jgi:hypothetical protein
MTGIRQLCAIALTYALGTAIVSAQTNPSTGITTGYVVITPTDGTPDGLLAFGNLTLTAGGVVSRGIFSASPLLNAAAIPVSTNTDLSQNTGVAVVNPNSQDVNISLVLRFASSTVAPLTQSFTLGAGQQTSKFVTEVFGQAAIAQGVPSVLTLISSMPVGVVGFNFEGSNFSAVPVTDLTTVLGANALATLNSDVKNANTSALNTTTNSNSSLTVMSIAGANVLVANTTPAGQFFPQISTSVGGNGSLILSQFAANGGWSNGIVIENPSQNPRTVRVDFFDANGAPLNVNFQSGSGTSFTNITIPAFGTFALTPVS